MHRYLATPACWRVCKLCVRSEPATRADATGCVVGEASGTGVGPVTPRCSRHNGQGHKLKATPRAQPQDRATPPPWAPPDETSRRPSTDIACFRL